MNRSKYLSHADGRPYAEIRGYLRSDLAAADIVSGVLTPESAVVAVYGLDAAGVWRYLTEAKVWNYDESMVVEEGKYVRANLNSDDRYEVYWASCSATVLAVPEAPGA